MTGDRRDDRSGLIITTQSHATPKSFIRPPRRGGGGGGRVLGEGVTWVRGWLAHVEEGEVRGDCVCACMGGLIWLGRRSTDRWMHAWLRAQDDGVCV